MVLRKVARWQRSGLGIEIEPIVGDGKPSLATSLAVIRKTGCARRRYCQCRLQSAWLPRISLLDWPPALEQQRGSTRKRVDVGNDRLPTLGECKTVSDAFFFDAWHFAAA